MREFRDRGAWLRPWSGVRRLVLAAGILAGGTASASILDVVEPASFSLSYDHIPFDVPSASQRIRIRNTTADPASGDVRLESGFIVTATGGSLGPGQEQFWDIACLPDAAPGPAGFFDLDWCGKTCDDASGLLSIPLSCAAGLVVAPSAQIALPRVFAYEVSQTTVAWTNTGSAPVTVTGLSVPDGFTAAPATGGLPQTVLPGNSLTTIVAFDTTRPDTVAQLDVLADTLVVGRTQVTGQTIKQIQPDNWFFDSVPQGAVYTLPIRVRNSSPDTRTITAVTSDDGEFTAEGLVGTTLAPGATADGLVRLTARTLGRRTANLAVAFDGP